MLFIGLMLSCSQEAVWARLMSVRNGWLLPLPVKPSGAYYHEGPLAAAG
jgi:hypothetical protein